MIVKTSKTKPNPNLFKSLYKLYQEFCRRKCVSAAEFIQDKLESGNLQLEDTEIDNFLSLASHEKFLEAVKNNFVQQNNLRNYHNLRIVTTIFVILFSEEVRAEEYFEMFKNVKCAFKGKLLNYFCNEGNLIQTALTGCKFFEDKYVIEQIIQPALSNTELFRQTEEFLLQEKNKKWKGKPPTVPDFVALAQRKKSVPIVPLNTPEEIMRFQAKQVPQSLYVKDSTERKLVGEFEKNRQRAQKLLEQAKSLDKNYCKAKKSPTPKEIPKVVFRAKQVPRSKSGIEIKGNIATVLKEASLCIKEQDREIKKIEDLMRGGATLDKYKELEEEERREEEQKMLDNIERKHLEGLMTFEDAIAAKQNLIESNKERFKEFMEERQIYLKEIDKWKEQEQEKIKQMVSKCHEIERNAKKAEMDFKEKIKNEVSQFKDEKRRLLQEAYERHQEELAKKVKLIEEIKTLHQLKSLHSVKEFDPNECPNMGLLCQMSIADLQKKLSEVKDNMEKELQRKRHCIQKRREKQKMMIENVKNFVAQSRMSKTKQPVVPIRQTNLARSHDLDKLRSRLEYAREQRRNRNLS